MKSSEIEMLREFIGIRARLAIEAFSQFRGRDRKMLDKVIATYREEDYHRVRDGNFVKAQQRFLGLSDVKGNIALDDVLLLAALKAMK